MQANQSQSELEHCFPINMADDDDNNTITDARFDDSRPQFQSIRSKDSKVVLDERFASALTDPRFRLPGRGNNKKQRKEAFSEFYTVQRSDDEEAPTSRSSDHGDKKRSSKDIDMKVCNKNKRQPKKGDPKETQHEPESRISHLMALARGEIDVSSSSDEDDTEGDDCSSSSDDDDDEASDGEEIGVLNANPEEVSLTESPSPYLAIMNLDWTNVRAVDIFAVVSSFVPPGSVLRVRVFPSDFGLQKMEKEQLTGPTSIWKRKRRQEPDADHDVDANDHCEASLSNLEQSVGEPEINQDGEFVESDFNPEKLRAYEVSKLKYYFGIVEFTDPNCADIAYKQVDGMEFEHSSAAVDMRSIEIDQIDDVVKDRPLRDESTGVPSNYEPPDFVVDALQQSNVDCTWDAGDRDRERVLTKYVSGDSWKALAEDGQLNQYLASDVSSADESSDEEGEKAQSMRKLLGLEGSENEDGSESGNDDDGDEDDARIDASASTASKQVMFIPAATKNVDDNQEDEIKPDLSPWEKYKEKRKQKKREKRQVARERRKKVSDKRKGSSSANETDPFFQKHSVVTSNGDETAFTQSIGKPDLDLLVAEDGDGQSGKDDYDMRALQRVEKNKDKKLKGKRKKKEEKAIESAVGDTFQVDTKDDRFRAVLDGSDARFGIDRTDPNFKDTTGMQTIMSEQMRRRKEKKRRIPDINNTDELAAGAPNSQELNSLVQKLKKKTRK